MADLYYEDIFKQNGASYHRAMQMCPAARDEEFGAVLSYLNANGGQLLDVPAGGGYLEPYLPRSWRYLGRDFSGGFDSAHNQVIKCTEVDLGVPDSSVDAVICLAALHHVENREAFYQAAKAALKPGGMFLIGDVVKGTKEDAFLNGFVDEWNHLGHEGDFIDEARDIAQLEACGFCPQYKRHDYHWNFESRAQAMDYFRLLFTLNKTPPDSELSVAIDRLGGGLTGNAYQTRWSLGFIQARLSGA